MQYKSSCPTLLPPGLRWSERKSYCQNIPVVDNQPPYNPREQYISYECVMPLDTMYGIFVALWLGYFVLAVYFDNILPNEYGVRRCVLRKAPNG